MLAEIGGAEAIAFDQIDKAPEEKARGITISTVRGGKGRAPLFTPRYVDYLQSPHKARFQLMTADSRCVPCSQSSDTTREWSDSPLRSM